MKTHESSDISDLLDGVNAQASGVPKHGDCDRQIMREVKLMVSSYLYALQEQVPNPPGAEALELEDRTLWFEGAMIAVAAR